MNNEYLARAKEKISDAKTLIILASKRARALAIQGARPMVRCKDENYLDIALLEIAEGLLEATYDASAGDDLLRELEAAKAAASPVEKVQE